jgi:hypothetical protein
MEQENLKDGASHDGCICISLTVDGFKNNVSTNISCVSVEETFFLRGKKAWW